MGQGKRMPHIWVGTCEQKYCAACNTYKPLDMFANLSSSWDGKQPKCRTCKNKYYQENKAHIVQQNKRNYQQNREHRLAHQRAYAEQHEEQIKNTHRQYFEKNRQKQYVLNRNNVAKRMEATGSFTLEEWQACRSFFNGRCAYCGLATAQLTIDHVVALANGGCNTIQNIVPACLSCNCSKKDSLVEEFLPLQHPFFKVFEEYKRLI